MDSSDKKTLLLVEDEGITVKLETAILEKYGYNVLIARSGLEALKIISDRRDIDLVLMDIVLGSDGDGIETAESILQIRNLPVVFLSYHTETEIVEKTEKITSYGFVVKNSGEAVLIAAIRMAFRLHEANENIKNQKEEIEAANEEMQAAMEEMEAINQELIETQKSLLESESKFRSIFENSPYPIAINRISDRVFIDLNREFLDFAGHTVDEVKNRQFNDIIILEDPDDYARMRDEFSDKGRLDRFQTTVINRKGETVYTMISAYRILINGEDCVETILTDISNLRKTENALRKNESELTSLFNALLVGVGMIIDRRFYKVNSFLCKLLGREEQELIGNLTKIIYLDDEEYERAGHDLYSMMEREGQGITKARIRHKNGAILDGLISLTPIDPENPSAGACATLKDITELSRAEEALHESEIRFRAIMEQSPMPMMIFDTGGILLDANGEWEKMWRVSKTETIGKYNIFQDSRMKKIMPDIEKAINGEVSDLPVEVYNTRYSNKGERLWLGGKVYPLKNNAGKVTNVIIISYDMTERVLAEEALRTSEDKFRNIFNNMTIGYYRTEMDGRILDINPACVRMFGYGTEDEFRSILVNHAVNVYARKDDWKMVRDKMLSGINPYVGIFTFVRKDGSEFTGSLNIRIIKTPEGVPIYIDGLIEDVTERIRTQEMLIQSEKMITVAGLAAGMAHEINNPLGIIMQNAENSVRRLTENIPGNIDAAISAGTDIDKIREYTRSRKIDIYLSSIIEAGGRAAKIVGNMLLFSRGTESRFASININVLLDKALDLAYNDYDVRKKYDFRNIRIIKKYGDLPDIQCAETPIEQVFLNIFKNSAQAMNSWMNNRQHVNEITIRTELAGTNIEIEISDNGPGMDETVRRRIFEPFYSTKEPGVGTGLGLSVSYYIIVDGHGGTISVKSSPGSGAAFIITLPVQRRL